MPLKCTRNINASLTFRCRYNDGMCVVFLLNQFRPKLASQTSLAFIRDANDFSLPLHSFASVVCLVAVVFLLNFCFVVRFLCLDSFTVYERALYFRNVATSESAKRMECALVFYVIASQVFCTFRKLPLCFSTETKIKQHIGCIIYVLGVARKHNWNPLHTCLMYVMCTVCFIFFLKWIHLKNGMLSHPTTTTTTTTKVYDYQNVLKITTRN